MSFSLWVKKWLYKKAVKNGNLYTWWSKKAQIYDKKFIGTKPSWFGLDHITAQMIMNRIMWKEDDIKRLGDAFRHPDVGDAMVNFIIKGNGGDPKEISSMDQAEIRNAFRYYTKGSGQPKKESFDCDDFSVWCATRLDKKYKAKILNVVWSTGSGIHKLEGHNMCVIEKIDLGRDAYFHMGNWGSYGPFHTMAEVVTDVMQKARAKKLVGWHLYKPEEVYKKS